jgi:hypothetical protein
MIGPAERYGNCDERKLHLDFVIVLPTAKTGFLFVGDRPYPVVRFSAKNQPRIISLDDLYLTILRGFPTPN